MNKTQEFSHFVILDTWLLYSFACFTQQSMMELRCWNKEDLISFTHPTTLTCVISFLDSWISICKPWKMEPGISGPRSLWSLSSSRAFWKLSSSWRSSSRIATSLQWLQTLLLTLRFSWYSSLFLSSCSLWSLMSFQGMKPLSIKRLVTGSETSSRL